MANPTSNFGLRPVRYKNGTPWNGSANPYYCPSGYNVDLFIGDPVVINGDSNAAEVSAVGAGTFGIGMLSEVILATLADGSFVTGVVIGVFPTTRDSAVYKATGVEAVVMVVDDPNVVFQIRDDGTTLLSVDTVGLNAIMLTGTGDTSTGLSAFTLDSDGDPPEANGTNMLAIRNLSRILDNEMAKNAVWDVTLQLHTELCGSSQNGVA